MSAHLEPFLRPPIAFADGGARAQVDADTVEAFDLAVRLGATGLRSSLWSTADGVLVVGRDGLVGTSRLRRRRPVGAVDSGALPPDVATFEELVGCAGPGLAIGLDVTDPAAAPRIVAAARTAEQRLGRPVLDHLWLAHDDVAVLAAWRRLATSLHLVAVTRLGRLTDGPERLAADLSAAGVDAARLPYGDWTGGLATLFHRFGVLAFADVVDHDRMLDELLRMGVDAVASPHVDRMADAMRRAGW